MKAPEVKALVDVLTERVKSQSEKLEELKQSLRIVLDFEKQLSLIQREIDDLKKWKDEQKKELDEQTRRRWAFGPNIVAAIITVILTLVCTLLLRLFVP